MSAHVVQPTSSISSFEHPHSVPPTGHRVSNHSLPGVPTPLDSHPTRGNHLLPNLNPKNCTEDETAKRHSILEGLFCSAWRVSLTGTVLNIPLHMFHSGPDHVLVNSASTWLSFKIRRLSISTFATPNITAVAQHRNSSGYNGISINTTR
jgi:hypothetical protein